MKHFTTFLIFCCLSGSIFAGWSKNYEKSLKLAKSQNKFILLDFTGSKWCGYCIKLEKNVFKKRVFKQYAKTNLICVELDFPRGKAPKRGLNELAQKYKVRGYPTIIILDPEGKQVGRTGYKSISAEKYVEHLQKIIEPHKKKLEAEKETTNTSKRATRK